MSKITSVDDANKIAKLCFEFYDKKLSKNGKPNAQEWTTLAAILVHFTDCKNADKRFKIVSLATGSKCLPASSLPLDGGLVHDSHAEVVARRGFMRYIYSELNKLAKESSYKSDVFESVPNTDKQFKQFKMKPNVEVILFCTHTPCGDASIIPMLNEADKEGENEDFVGLPPAKRLKTDDTESADIHRTGAKCVPTSSIQDSKEKGVNYHEIRVLRTKPGRGDPTISLSCSDKIAKWLVLGMQGSLLSNFLPQPIYPSTIIISKCPYNQESMERALMERSEGIKDLPEGFCCFKPTIIQSNLDFKDSKSKKQNGATKLNACPTSICWSEVDDKKLFVLVRGNLLGVTQKSGKAKKEIRAPISQYEFLSLFKNLSECQDDDLSYENAKILSKDYKKALEAFLASYNDWIRTDPKIYYQFKLKV